MIKLWRKWNKIDGDSRFAIIAFPLMFIISLGAWILALMPVS
jgi:hypothetical protein